MASKHRLEMCRLAVRSSDWITVSDWEAMQPCYQRTISVLRHVEQQSQRYSNLKEDAFGGPGAPAIDTQPAVHLLCGSDLLSSFEVPDLWAPEDVGCVCVD